MDIFLKNKNYSLQEVNNICNQNDLAVVDCLKDENLISIEKWNAGEGEDCLFEFDRVDENLFKLSYIDEFLITSMSKRQKCENNTSPTYKSESELL